MLYTIQYKGVLRNGVKKTLVGLADSAIGAGPRPLIRRLALLALLGALAAPAAAAAATRPLDAYRGRAAWVDRYDPSVLDDPWPALSEMRAHGVRTLFLETANYRLPRRSDFADPVAAELILDEAHALGIRVVAWYLPGLADVTLDLRRSTAALDYVTPYGGQRFDGLAVDIEATAVGSIAARNRAVVAYTRALRSAAGPDRALGAIVPDERSSTIAPGLWPGFPFRALAPYYDVFLPMAYSTLRGAGAGFVYAYTRANVGFLRSATGRPVHLIAGLSDGLSGSEAAAAMRGARASGAIGASFYDFSLSLDATWAALARFR